MVTRTSSRHRGLSGFDRAASTVAKVVAKAWFFVACALIVCIWAPSFWVIGDVDTWQLIINTLTTIITFLLVALLQNTQYRSDKAVQQKLNAVVEALADIMEALAERDPSMARDVKELRRASGLEEREGT
jgi:low affinity Fe/Cu permease